ncbi:YraN family protein [Alloscardovia venturai]|uniref:YraN family protein n=1 Tax=Alloscardovia venturai TaxID=1769421 RepID=UPI00366D886A
MRRIPSRRAHSQALGAFGEDYACEYLTKQGWTIIERNWHCRYGEIDIIARCPEPSGTTDSLLVFVEVKTRTSQAYGTGLESIDASKQQHLRKAAILWLSSQKMEADSSPTLVRFDAIELAVRGLHVTQLTHVRRIL